MCTNNGHGFALGWVDLSGHDGATRFVLWKAQLTKTAGGRDKNDLNILKGSLRLFFLKHTGVIPYHSALMISWIKKPKGNRFLELLRRYGFTDLSIRAC